MVIYGFRLLSWDSLSCQPRDLSYDIFLSYTGGDRLSTQVYVIAATPCRICRLTHFSSSVSHLRQRGLQCPKSASGCACSTQQRCNSGNSSTVTFHYTQFFPIDGTQPKFLIRTFRTPRPKLGPGIRRFKAAVRSLPNEDALGYGSTPAAHRNVTRTDNALRKSVHLPPETMGPPRHTLAPIPGNLSAKP